MNSDYNQLEQDAFWVGQGAYYKGLQADDNPYNLWDEPECYSMWLDGWRYGQQTILE